MRIRAELRERFARLANELARGQNMPSMFESDHGFGRATARTKRKRVIEDAERANGQCEAWALEVLGILDALEAPRRRS
jgi:hypothetical protein